MAHAAVEGLEGFTILQNDQWKNGTANFSEHGLISPETAMKMPLSSRILFSLSALGLAVGAHMADFFSNTHIFNDRWPPHAKFHTGQTLSMSILLGVMSVFFAWRKTADNKTTVYAAAGFAVLYWITQATAILYPNTAFYDPEFVTSNSFPLGLPGQAYFEIGFLAVIGLASWLALRKDARWVE